MNLRIKAICSAVKHGFLPSCLYEKTKHYECSYLRHLWINIKYACRWASFCEDQSDIEFEKNNITEEDKKFHEHIKDTTGYIYDTGFSEACESIIKAVRLIPVETISKDHVIKLIGIVHRIHNEKK